MLEGSRDKQSGGRSGVDQQAAQASSSEHDCISVTAAKR
ncbi:hypothetical protein PVAP13_8NG173304 [Panicum virgatum]|uniref:Uncharacterized protein n=1 Tax=Panicum virgatum TaxID=38727 RepID=A0A8T0P526_PANVG|nr:hypothetical protein PVAP13_8NG173304 [Panicum virgatum]